MITQGYLASLREQLRSFWAQDSDWQAADDAIVSARSALQQKLLPCNGQLMAAVASEVDFQKSMWQGDYVDALGHARSVIGHLDASELRGYRALWFYLAGVAAWLRAKHVADTENDCQASDYFRKAQGAAPDVKWLVDLGRAIGGGGPRVEDDSTVSLIERLEQVLEELGMVHDRRFSSVEREILEGLLQDDDGILFEQAHTKLGWLLGYVAGNSDDEAAPDPWWCVDASWAFVFEDYIARSESPVLSPTKARQAATHSNWLHERNIVEPGAEVIAVLVTPCRRTSVGAVPHLRNVRYWELSAFRKWAQNALGVVRELRREFVRAGDLAWRAVAIRKFREHGIAPRQLDIIVKASAAESMHVDGT